MSATTLEKIGLLIITGLIVIALGLIGSFAIFHGIDAGGATLVGVVATGLASFGKDIIAALRGYSMSAQLSKVTDQLAASTPGAGALPADAIAAADQVASAANDKADAIKAAAPADPA